MPEEKEVAETPEEGVAGNDQRIKELEEEIANAKDGASAAIKELKAEIKKRDEEIARLAEANKPKDETPKVEQKIGESAEEVFNRLMAEREASRVAELKSGALAEFIASKKELSASNDPGGLKVATFKEKLSRFSTEGMTTKEQFLSVFTDAYRLSGLADTGSENSEDEDSSPAPIATNEPKTVKVDTLTKEQKEQAARVGMKEEEYAKHLAKYGDQIQVLNNAAMLAG